MDANARAELESIKRELSSIISELEDISQGIRKDFVGIGNLRCAACLDSVISNYRRARKKLYNLDISAVPYGDGGGGASW